MRHWIAGGGLVLIALSSTLGSASADSIVPVTPHAWCYAYAFNWEDPWQEDQDWNHAYAWCLASAGVDCNEQVDGSLFVRSFLSRGQNMYASARIIDDPNRPSTVTIGTSTEYPLGTELLLVISATADPPYGHSFSYLYRADGTQIWDWQYPWPASSANTSLSVTAGEVLRIKLDQGDIDTPGYYVTTVTLSVAPPPLLPGDTNCDGVISYADINPFVLAISSQTAYKAQYPNCWYLNADCNADGVVSFADIDPFIALLAK